MFERSFHFIPANRPSFCERIHSLGADAIIFDLEDAVPAGAKAQAIAFLHTWLAENRMWIPAYVRVNGTDSPWAAAEARLLSGFPDLGIVLPKVGDAKSTRESLEYYHPHAGREIILLIEDIAALHHLPEICRITGVAGIGIGFEDLFASLPFPPSELGQLTTRIRTELAMHAMAAGVIAIDSISLDLTGGMELRHAALEARSAGLNAKFSIHPSQIPAINEIFSPAPQAVAEAGGILALAATLEDPSGYAVVRGEILSPPKIRKAATIISHAQHHENQP